MSKEYDRRATVVESLCARHSVQQIIKWFGYPKSTVYDITKRFNDGVDSTDCKEYARKRSVRNQDFIIRLQKIISDDRNISIRKLNKLMGVIPDTMRKAIQEDLRYKSYVLKVRQMLSDEMKAKRVARCSLLLTSINHEAAGRIQFFSDEKIFTVDAKVNRRNDK